MPYRERVISLSLLLALASTSLSGCQNTEKPTGQAIPPGFHITCYPKSDCTKADAYPLGDGKFNYTVVLVSNDDRFKVENFYKTEMVMRGYRILREGPQPDNSIVIAGMNDTENVSISIITIDPKTVISITVMPKPKN